MANTQVLVANLNNQYQANIYQKTVAYAHVNMKYEPTLLDKGDTVKVKYFNPVTLNTVASSGETITVDDWTELSDDLVVNQVRNKGQKIKDIEELRSNTNVQMKLTELITNASAQVLDTYAFTTAIANAPVVLTSGTPSTESKNTIFASIETMRVQLAKRGLGTGQMLFVPPAIASLIRQSGVYDATAEGLNERQKANFVTKLSGFTIVESNNIPTADAGANTYMVAWDEEAINGAEQMNKFKIETEGTGAMASRLLYELVFGMDSLGLNPARISCKKITVATA